VALKPVIIQFSGLVLKWANSDRNNVYNHETHEIHEKINLSYFVSFRVFRGLNKTAEVRIDLQFSIPYELKTFIWAFISMGTTVSDTMPGTRLIRGKHR
jgi:hypothetical protein